MATKKAKIKQGGLFKKGKVIIDTYKKNGEAGETKAYDVVGKVRIEEMDDGRVILVFNSVGSTSVRSSSKGTISGGRSLRHQNIVVDEFEFME